MGARGNGSNKAEEQGDTKDVSHVNLLALCAGEFFCSNLVIVYYYIFVNSQKGGNKKEAPR